MRRNWIAVFLFVWALGLRALLPASAGVVHGEAAASGAKQLSLCLPGQILGALAETPAKPGSGEKTPHHPDCLWCALSCDGVALTPTAAYSGAVFSPWRDAPWTQKRADWSFVRHTTAHQARAPPSSF